MEYFLINNIDFSHYVNALTVAKSANYSAQTNAAGNTVVDYINSKRTITVGIIPLDDDRMLTLLQAIAGFNVSISILNPHTKAVETINCIIPDDNIEYYTIRADKVSYKALTLTFIEL